MYNYFDNTTAFCTECGTLMVRQFGESTAPSYYCPKCNKITNAVTYIQDTIVDNKTIISNKFMYEDRKECGHFKDIIDCIQEKVDTIVKKHYGKDSCYPIFKVSVLWKSREVQELLLNCTHLGSTYSRVLFPNNEAFWGYDSLGEIIESLYNQTM